MKEVQIGRSSPIACRDVKVSSNAALWLERVRLKQLVGLRKMRPGSSSCQDGCVIVNLVGPAIALDNAEAVIQEFMERSSNDIEKRISVPVDSQGKIVGKQWSRWKEIVNRCGGPEDPLQQRLMIDL
jgi:hypothetical protein